jgi:YbbR domain-containing protein
VAIDVGYSLRAALTENLNLKVLSLLFALALYSMVHGSQEAQRSLMLSVVALTPPENSNKDLVSPIPAEIRVTVRGPRSMLDDLHADDIPVQLDLRSGTVARKTFEPGMITVPPGITVQQIDPPEIDLKWEDRIVRDVPIEVGVVGTPAPGFVVKMAPSADPKTVRVQGPKSEVLVLQRARADAFEVGGLTEGKYTRQLAIERPPPRVTYDAPIVSATVEIGREVVERPFTKVPVSVIGHPSAKAQPVDVDVRLSCPPEVVRALRAEQLLPRVQITSTAEHGADAVPVQLAIDQCEVHVTPASVIVRW